MKVRSFRVTNELWNELGEISKEKGITKSELIRLILEESTKKTPAVLIAG